MEHQNIDRTSWRCKYERRKKCKARLLTYGRTLKIMRGEHSHESFLTDDLRIIYFTHGKKYPKLIIDRYEFMLERKYADKTAWTCKYKEKKKCKARLLTFGRTVKLMNSTHNHIADFNGDVESLISTFVNIEEKEKSYIQL
ncbi:hypothetical protein HHI36_012690 [Cryptolaemus montrouzieri]|uniref:FLYWCH-type domain-containing protein n=1 Tax=Cryptolaemus montrouzieri TaxID=559131 RepID=A0ABD2NFV2_9CUCU